MITRSQTRKEQSSIQAASLGVYRPQRLNTPLQGNADVVDTIGLGGSQVSTAGVINVENRTAGPDNLPTKCNRTRCATCKIFQINDQIISTITKRKHTIINNKRSSITCISENLIYLIQ